MRATRININWHPGLSIYACEPFLKVAGDEYGWLGGIADSGGLRCLLPYTIIRKPGIRFVRFRVETIPLADGFNAEDERKFLSSVVDYFRSTGADLIIPGTNTAVFRTYPEGAAAAPYGTFVMDLTQPEEALFGEIYADFRANIRRAIKAGVRIETGIEHLETAYELIANTLKRSSLKFRSYEEFKRLISSFGENVRIIVAQHEGVVQACMVTPFSEYSGYSWFSGTVSKPVKGAMHLVQWEAIRQCRELGAKCFNFTGIRINPEKGSKQDGIMTFKQRFGGKLVQGYMWKYSISPLKSMAYSLGVRLLGGDIVDQERTRLAAVAGSHSHDISTASGSQQPGRQ